MAELTARTPLDGYARDFGATRLAEATGLAIVSLAVPQGDEDTCAAALRAAYGAEFASHGRYVTSTDGTTRLVRTAPDQLFALFDHAAPDASKMVAKATGETFWTTDQSDAWAALTLAGPLARQALERICPIDLHAQAFPPDASARTVMEHLGVLIFRTGEDAFLLLSARSSARSFLHAVETSLDNVA